MAAAVVATLLVGVSGSAAVAQTVADVEARDRLIADQENLLNAYRCLFGVDVSVVPGGCPDPDDVSPGAAPRNPSQHDIAVRDQLVQSQEALLNVYRCRFDVDTQIVPGGCVDGAPALPDDQLGIHGRAVIEDGMVTTFPPVSVRPPKHDCLINEAVKEVVDDGTNARIWAEVQAAHGARLQIEEGLSGLEYVAAIQLLVNPVFAAEVDRRVDEMIAQGRTCG
ncbi:MAG: hypothetical protein OXT07_13390 [bacterium]|nr:hypothetical protein [bacterium]